MSNKISTILSNEDIKIDELGRIVIENDSLLEEIRGAVAEFAQDGHLGDNGDCNTSNCDNTNCG
jgi:hypothetical protein